MYVEIYIEIVLKKFENIFYITLHLFNFVEFRGGGGGHKSFTAK